MLKRVINITEAPIIVAMLFGSAAWSVTHMVDRLLAKPIVAYSVAETRDVPEVCFESVNYTVAYEVRVSNLADHALRGIDLFIDTRRHSQDTQIVGPACAPSAGQTVSDARDAHTNQTSPTSRREVFIDELLPGARLVVYVPLDDPIPGLAVLARSSAVDGAERASFDFREEGFQTWLIRYEYWIVGFFFIVFLLFGTYALFTAEPDGS